MTAVAAAVVVAAAGCASGSSPGIAEPRPGATGSTSSSAAPPSRSPTPSGTAPLTGRPVTSAEQAARVIVGIPVLTGEGRPRAEGLDRADLLYITFPTPETQRVLAVFQSQEADRVGPVAELRPLDGRMLAPLGGSLASAGGSAGQLARLESARVPHLSADQHPEAFTATDSGLYASTASARSAGGRPALDGLVAFRAEEEGGPAPAPVLISMPGHAPVVLRHDGDDEWAGVLHTIPLRAANVVIQQVEHEVIEPGDGGAELDPVVVGRGVAVVLSGSRTITATWSRPTRFSVTNYVGKDGIPVRVLPGVTIVLLAPPGTVVAPA